MCVVLKEARVTVPYYSSENINYLIIVLMMCKNEINKRFLVIIVNKSVINTIN